MTGVRVCLKELYKTKYDPLSISYTVLSGKTQNVFPVRSGINIIILCQSRIYCIDIIDIISLKKTVSVAHYINFNK